MGRLGTRTKEHTHMLEQSQRNIRREHTPRLARQLLHITSLRNIIAYGMPLLSKEIGRGQFGVVYSCSSWGPYEHLAVKSILPPDDRHWHDISLEIFYSKWV